MTHDELLARLNEIGSKYCVDEGANKNACDEVHKLENALRAVVEIHKTGGKNDISSYVTYENGLHEEIKVPACIGCGFNGEYSIWDEPYPCPTIQAIEKELA